MPDSVTPMPSDTEWPDEDPENMCTCDSQTPVPSDSEWLDEHVCIDWYREYVVVNEQTVKRSFVQRSTNLYHLLGDMSELFVSRHRWQRMYCVRLLDTCVINSFLLFMTKKHTHHVSHAWLISWPAERADAWKGRMSHPARRRVFQRQRNENVFFESASACIWRACVWHGFFWHNAILARMPCLWFFDTMPSWHACPD